MPTIFLYSDKNFTREEKAKVAKQLTECAMAAVETSNAPKRGRVYMMYFQHISRDDMAVNGVLASDGAPFLYRVEYRTYDLTIELRVEITKTLPDKLLEILNIPNTPENIGRVVISFGPYAPEDLSIGKVFVHANHLQNALKI